MKSSELRDRSSSLFDRSNLCSIGVILSVPVEIFWPCRNLELAILSPVAHGLPVVPDEAVIAFARNLVESKPVEQPNDIYAAIMSDEDQRDRNIAIATETGAGIMAGLTAEWLPVHL